MATPKAQRVGIWIITVVMIVGTVASFIAMIVTSDNNKKDQEEYAKIMQQMQEQQKAQTSTAEPLDGHSASTFDAASVTELQKEILQEGDGEEVGAEDTIRVSYFGWTPDGKIFDSSKKSGTDTPASLSLTSVIKGWTEGLTSVKVGSTVKLIIPADKAYGESGSGASIPPNTPLTFILTIHSKQAKE